jgi:hypothetical protein
MTLHTARRSALAALAATLTAFVLAACSIQSSQLLITPEDVFADNTAISNFRRNGDVFEKVADQGVVTKSEGGYLSPDGKLTVWLQTRADGSLIVAVRENAKPQFIHYGYGVRNGDFLRVQLALKNNAMSELEGAGFALPANSAATRDWIVVTDAAGVEELISHIADGTITTTMMVIYTGTQPAPDKVPVSDVLPPT